MLTALYVLFAGSFVVLAVLGHVFLLRALSFRRRGRSSSVVRQPRRAAYDHLAVLS